MNTKETRKILVIEDDKSLNRLICAHLGNLGLAVRGVETGAEARQHVAEFAPDLVFLDVRLPDCSGMDLLAQMSDFAPVIVMTAHGAVEQAVRALRAGAVDYLVKPISFETLQFATNRALETAALKRDLRYWQEQAQQGNAEILIGDSPALTDLRRQIELFSVAEMPVLIKGAGGTGKELIARTMHEASARAGGQFLSVDCDPSQKESFANALFGLEDAGPGSDGMFERAAGGTLFLRDIADLSLAAQAKLLRMMERENFRRTGDDVGDSGMIDARIIMATQHDLEDLVKQKRFRSDLYFFLNAFQIEVPPLRNRTADVAPLARFFLANRSFQKGVEKAFSPDALALLEAYSWPGNVRELRNAVERSVILSGPAAIIQKEHLVQGNMPDKTEISGQQGGSVVMRFDTEPNIDELRAAYLRLLLERYGGNRSKVASVLGISERNTYRLIPRLLH